MIDVVHFEDFSLFRDPALDGGADRIHQFFLGEVRGKHVPKRPEPTVVTVKL